MRTLTDIPFSLDADRILKLVHAEPGSDDAADILSLVERAQQVGRPKAAYAECFITKRDGDRIQIDGTWFTSRTLVHNLESAERAFPHLATCGHEMDQEFPGEGDMLKEFWWDVIKSELLGAATRHVGEEMHRRFRLEKTSTMRPGAGDVGVWPIEQQRALFTILGNVEEELSVRLTDSFLMVPNKTTSGLLYPTETDFRSCEVCHREKCPSRNAPFNRELWQAIQHD